MHPDRPIASADEDTFRFAPLAEQLAPHLLLATGSPSLVAGIEAPWGSGKTSFLNLTRNALRKLAPNAVVLEYCPWVYSTADSLILGFCVQLASQFQNADASAFQNVSRALVGFSQALKPLRLIPGVEPFMAAVGTVVDSVAEVAKSAAEMSKLDITSAKKVVQKALDDAKLPVVIFVDDVDRLQPQDVRLLFQFLKAVADFNGVSYVLAYDPIPVEQALSHGGTLDGKEYLKKFIQCPIRLPRSSRMHLIQFLTDAVESVCSSRIVPIKDVDYEALRTCVTSDLVMRCIKTPRDVVRCFNLFRLRLTDCYGEVDVAELFKFILLDLICPEAVDLVRKNPDLFIAGASMHPEFAGSPKSIAYSMFARKGEAEGERNKLVESLKNERESARRLLDDLFPTTRAFGESHVRSAGSTYGLIKLLFGGASPTAFSAKEATDFLLGERRPKILKEKVQAGVLKEWLYFLSSITDGENVADPTEIASLLIASYAEYNFPEEGVFENISRVIPDYLTQLISKMTSEDEVVAFVETVISFRESLIISHNVVLSLARSLGLWKDGVSIPLDQAQPRANASQIVSAKRVRSIIEEWLRRVRESAAENLLHEQPELGSLLHRWGQFPDNDYSEVQEYIAKFCENNDALLLLRRFPISIDQSGMEKLFAKHDVILTSLDRYESEGELRQLAKGVIERLRADAMAKANLVADDGVCEEPQNPAL